MIRASRWVLVLLIGIVAVQGCSSSKKNKADTSPDAFTFTDVADVALGVVVESNTVTVAGIDQAAGVSVSGASGATYAINGGTFVASAGSVNAGDRVVVKVTSSAEFSDPVNVTLNIGGVSDVFTVTTLAADTTPEAFTFAAQTVVEFDSWGVSEAITVSGINTDTPISVTGGEYKIGDGAFTSDAGLVTDGDSVVVRVKASVKAETEQVATLTIGGESADLSVTSGPDTVAPEVAILFPPPYTMTEGDTVFVRGTARDLNGSITSIKIGNVNAQSTDGFEHWSAVVPLVEGENTLDVVATDSSVNSSVSKTVKVRMDPDSGSFPDNISPIGGVGFSGDFGVIDDSEVYLIPDRVSSKIVAIELDSAERSVVSDNVMQEEFPLDIVSSLVWDNERNLVYIADWDAIFELNLNTKLRSVLISKENNNFISNPLGMVLLPFNGVRTLFVADDSLIYSVNLESNESFLLTDGNPASPTPVGEVSFDESADVQAIGYSAEIPNVIFATTKNKLYSVGLADGSRKIYGSGFLNGDSKDMFISNDGLFFTIDSSSGEVYKFDKDIDESQVISSNEVPNTENAIMAPFGIDCKNEKYCLIPDPILNVIFAMDIESGQRVVFSKTVVE